MATLTRPKHGSTFWVLTTCVLIALVVVVVLAVVAIVHPGYLDALYVAWTLVTGNGSAQSQ